MKLFVSTLTIYSYRGDKLRKKLNEEEVSKFTEGMHNGEDFDRAIVFSDYDRDEIKGIAETLSVEERNLYISLINMIENFKWVTVDLTDYDSSYRKMYGVMEDLISSHIRNEDVSIKLNLSCGHKIGSLALYLATMNVVHSKEYYKYMSIRRGRKLSVDAYHAEKGIVEKLPTMNFESETKGDWERLLLYLLNSIYLYPHIIPVI